MHLLLIHQIYEDMALFQSHSGRRLFMLCSGVVEYWNYNRLIQHVTDPARGN